MDVVAKAGSVGSRVVASKHLEVALGQLADGDLRQEGEEVARLANGVLAHRARRVRSGRVEVAQRDRLPRLWL